MLCSTLYQSSQKPDGYESKLTRPWRWRFSNLSRRTGGLRNTGDPMQRRVKRIPYANLRDLLRRELLVEEDGRTAQLIHQLRHVRKDKRRRRAFRNHLQEARCRSALSVFIS
jgi:hypothetical protein